MILYATGTKASPSISLYDAGEGQLGRGLPEDLLLADLWQ